MPIRNKAELNSAILELEARKTRQERELVQQFKATRDSFRPMNLLKDGLQKITGNRDLPEDLVKTIAGLGIGLLSKKLLIGRSNTFLKKIMSGALEFAVAKGTVKHMDKIKAYGTSIYHNLFRKNSNHHPDRETIT